MATADGGGPARHWGIQSRYQTASGEWTDAPHDTVAAIIEAMTRGSGESPSQQRKLLFYRGPGTVPLRGPGVVTLEDGRELPVDEDAELPDGLPPGYHQWAADGEEQQTVVVSPRSCPMPSNPPAWGWAVQVYAMRSRGSWGMGDLADLRRMARWSGGSGAGLLLVNPLHAARPGLPQAASPYYPSSRRFRNPLYLRVEEVPGADALGDRLAQLVAAGRRLNAERLIDRDRIFALKMEALEALWQRFPGDPRFDEYRTDQGPALAAYAAFSVLCEQHGSRWRGWPSAYRHPDRPEVRAAAERAGERVRFHEWLQWLVDVQLEAASAEIPVVHDLAVGFEPDGADAWLWQDSLAPGMSVGAPPDEFNTSGQDWGLPPFDPWRLRAGGYQPFIETIRASLRHAGGLRLDHVMGLFRLFWVPHGAGAAAGAYVRYPAGDLLDLVALESHRAGAYVVGEDLGTVEDEVRRELAARQVLSYRLVWFEDRPPPEYPERALAAVTTHDLPTVPGMWTGADLDAQRTAGTNPNEAGARDLRRRVQEVAGVDGDAPVTTVVSRLYQQLARAPSMLITATLEDPLGVTERPNMPGTVDSWPNWSIALPVPLEDVERHPDVNSLMAVLRGERDGRRPAGR